MKEKDDIKVKPRFTTPKGIPSSRTPVNYMGEEISVPNKEKMRNENRIKIVKQKYKDKRKPLVVNKRKTKNK